ncbi:MAG: DUF924 domain-containing protein [Gammaproteobacteria bacterium]|nr:DUF924 domain-containing protein [Gammaproteobacteria bacterium]
MVGSDIPTVTAAGINAFWLGPSPKDPEAAKQASGRWYAADDRLDDDIRRTFGTAMDQARAGVMSGWRETAEGALALVILLDQFTRNAYRGTARAFSGDAMAREVATGALDKGLDHVLPIPGRLLLYHPFEHSEDLEDQRRSVALCSGLAAESPSVWREYIDSFLRYAHAHLEVIERFGRFPHRNEILGRESTPAEQDWLSTHGGF